MAPSTTTFPQLAAAMLLVLTVHHLTHAQPETSKRSGDKRSPTVNIAAPRLLRRHVKNMVFYMHDVPAPPNQTAVIVATQKSKLGMLGTTLIFDDKLTEGPDPGSTEIGRGQGMYSFSSLTSMDLFLVFTAVLHRPAVYNGSTISLHGSDRIFLPEREIAVVGGTGHFRFAQGYAVLSTVSFSKNGIAVIKFNITMLV